jgi:hypothetical protein
MGAAVLLACLVAGVVAAAYLVERPRTLFPLLMLCAALGYGCLLAMVDVAAPFTAGGDDRAYFSAAQVRLQGAGWFDFGQFRQFGQGGYPLMLAWVYQAAGASTFVFKAVNLACFLLLVVLWFRIGTEMGGRRAAWAFAVAVLLGTPLWLYWMFILKDMTIVLLQSLFLLGAVRLGSGRGGPRAWIPLLAGTVLLIPFRVYLVLLHAVVTLAAVVLAGRQSAARKAALLGVAAVLLGGGLVYLAGNKQALAAFGAAGNDRALDYETLMEVSGRFADQRSKFSGPAGMIVFPLAYVFGETSGLRVGSGDQGTEAFMTSRPDVMAGGLGALPWIFFGSPLFGYALGHMLLRPLRRLRARRAARRLPAPLAPRVVHLPGQGWETGGTAVALQSVRVAAAPSPAPARDPGAVAPAWAPLLVFLVLYAVVAWMVEDTTRWRMPAFPVMAALAAQGWIWLRPQRRILLVGGWATTLAVLFTLYYGVLK